MFEPFSPQIIALFLTWPCNANDYSQSLLFDLKILDLKSGENFNHKLYLLISEVLQLYKNAWLKDRHSG